MASISSSNAPKTQQQAKAQGYRFGLYSGKMMKGNTPVTNSSGQAYRQGYGGSVHAPKGSAKK